MPRAVQNFGPGFDDQIARGLQAIAEARRGTATAQRQSQSDGISHQGRVLALRQKQAEQAALAELAGILGGAGFDPDTAAMGDIVSRAMLSGYDPAKLAQLMMMYQNTSQAGGARLRTIYDKPYQAEDVMVGDDVPFDEEVRRSTYAAGKKPEDIDEDELLARHRRRLIPDLSSMPGNVRTAPATAPEPAAMIPTADPGVGVGGVMSEAMRRAQAAKRKPAGQQPAYNDDDPLGIRGSAPVY